MEGADVATGEVLWFNPVMGHGYIKPSDGCTDVPVHRLAVELAGYKTLKTGQGVRYEVVRGYLDGMAAKAAFLATLGAAWTLGAGGWAWPIGLAAAVLALRARRPRRDATTTAPPGRAPSTTGAPRLLAASLDAGSAR